MTKTTILRRTLLIATILLATTNSAHAYTASFDRWQIGLQAAALHWDGPPPCGQPSIEHHDTRPSWANLDTLAWVTAKPTDPLLTRECVVHLDEGAESLNPGLACALVVHEVGHLVGKVHNLTDPHDVMSPHIPDDWRDVWSCRRLLKRQRYGWACHPRRDICDYVYHWSLRR